MYKLIVKEDGYLARTSKNSSGGCKNKNQQIIVNDWWLGKPDMNVIINHLPQRYWGERIRIKIEIIDDVINQEIIN